MMSTRCILLIAMTGLVAGCGGAEPGDPDSGSMPDAGSESPDAVTATMVGQWFWRAPNDWTSTYELRADGSATVDMDQFPMGRYTVEGSWSTADDMFFHEGDVIDTAFPWTYYRVERTYAFDGDRLLLDALRPDGEPEGWVGTWRGSYTRTITYEDTSVPDGTLTKTLELVVRADGTGELREIRSQSSSSWRGTWTETAGGLDLTYTDVYGQDETLSFHLVDGALGVELHERI